MEKKYKLASPDAHIVNEQDIALVTEYQTAPTSPKGIAARNKLMEKYLPLVERLVTYNPTIQRHDRDDVQSEVMLRMPGFIDKYDSSRGSFRTYITYRSKLAITNASFKGNQVIKQHIDNIRLVKGAENDIVTQTGRTPSVLEIAEHLNTSGKLKNKISPRTVLKRLQTHTVINLDSNLNEDGSRAIETLADKNPSMNHAEFLEQDEKLDTEQKATKLRALIDALDPTHKEMLEMHLDGATFKNIGDKFGYSKETARQLIMIIKTKLQAQMEGGKVPTLPLPGAALCSKKRTTKINETIKKLENGATLEALAGEYTVMPKYLLKVVQDWNKNNLKQTENVDTTEQGASTYGKEA